MRGRQVAQAAGGRATPSRGALVALSAACVAALLAVLIVSSGGSEDTLTMISVGSAPPKGDIHQPFATSPPATARAGPAPTLPDDEAYARLGLPPPLTLDRGPTEHAAEGQGSAGAASGPGIDEPFTTSPATTTPPPTSTIARTEQRIELQVDRVEVVPPPGSTTSMGSATPPGSSPEVAGETTGRGSGSGPLPRTGAAFVGLLVLLAVGLIVGGLLVRTFAGRRS